MIWRGLLTLAVFFLPLLSSAARVDFNYLPGANNLEEFPPKELKKILEKLYAVERFECNSTGCDVKLKPILSDITIKHVSPVLYLDLEKILGLNVYYRYSTQDLLAASQNVLFYLKNHGYLDAETTARLFIDKKGFAKLSVEVNEGRRYFWGGFKFENAPFSSEEFYKKFNKPLGIPFSYTTLYDALYFSYKICKERGEGLSECFIYYTEPFEVRKGMLLTLLRRDFQIKPSLALDFLSTYLDFFLENPVGAVKFLFKKVLLVKPVIKVERFTYLKVKIKGARKIPPERVIGALSKGSSFISSVEIERRILNLYEKEGFCNTTVNVKLRGKTVFVSIREGKTYRVVFILPRELKGFTPPCKSLSVRCLERVKRDALKFLRDRGIPAVGVELKVIKRPKRKTAKVILKPVLERLKVCTVKPVLRVGNSKLKRFLRKRIIGFGCEGFKTDGVSAVKTLLNLYGCISPTVKVEKKGGETSEVLLVEVSCKGRYRLGRTAYWIEGSVPEREIDYLIPKFDGKRLTPKRVYLLKRVLEKASFLTGVSVKRASFGNRTSLVVEGRVKKPVSLGGYIGYSSDQGLTGELHSALYNVLKTGEVFKFKVRYTQRQETYSLNYFDYNFFSKYLFAGAGLFRNYEEHRDYTLWATGFSLSAGLHLNLYTDLSLNFLQGDYSVEGGSDYSPYKKLGLSLSVDYPLFNFLFKQGFFKSYAVYYRGISPVSFDKFEVKNGLVLNPDGFYINSKLFFGLVSSKAPIFEKFYLGGLENLKGFSYEGIAPPGGGDIYWYWGEEFGLPLFKKGFYLFTGFDAGNAVKRGENPFKYPRWDLFLGGGISTAAGPIRGGLAWPYQGKLNLTNFRIFISIGFQF